MCDPGKTKSIWNRTRNADLEFVGTAKGIGKESLIKKKKEKKKKRKTVVREFVVNGKKRVYRGPEIVACRPVDIGNNVCASEFDPSEVSAREKELYLRLLQYEIYQDFDLAGGRPKVDLFKPWNEKEKILRANARRRRKRKTLTPNIRLASQILAAQIRAAI